LALDAVDETGFGTDNAILEAVNVEVSFTSFNSGQLNAVSVNEYSEQDPFGVLEWVEFFSVFYNKEAVAADVVNESRELWDCHTRLVSGTDAPGASVTPGRKPKVLWAYRSPEEFGGLWTGATCPNFYGEMIEDAGRFFIPPFFFAQAAVSH
jgi:hypothetical protein